MSATETIRRAARDLHIDATAMDDCDYEFFHAVADWLEAAVADAESRAKSVNARYPGQLNFTADDVWVDRNAIAVAGAYLGEQP